MLSDRGIRQAIKSERLIIDPFDEMDLGPCSYDLEIERIWELDYTLRHDIPADEDEMLSFWTGMVGNSLAFSLRTTYILALQKSWYGSLTKLSLRQEAALLD